MGRSGKERLNKIMRTIEKWDDVWLKYAAFKKGVQYQY